MTYTYIIIGGGSSGCVVANRLSKNPAHKVLLLESGHKNSDFWIPESFYKVVERRKMCQIYFKWSIMGHTITKRLTEYVKIHP